jgi:NAD(P)H-nitrite reductase large subunit
MEAVAKEFIVKNNLVCEVILNNGDQIPADVVVLGAGIIPSTGYIKNGVNFNPRDKSVICDVVSFLPSIEVPDLFFLS